MTGMRVQIGQDGGIAASRPGAPPQRREGS